MLSDWMRRALWGTVFVTIAGSALHFAFDWAGRPLWLAWLAAVNESVWEHLKLAFWPSLALAAWLFLLAGRRKAGYWAIEGLCLPVAPILIVAIFYSYTALLGGNRLWLDIATFFVAVAAQQFLSARLHQGLRPGKFAKRIGLALLALTTAAFLLLTYVPPDLPLFIDSRNGLAGIEAGADAVSFREHPGSG